MRSTIYILSGLPQEKIEEIENSPLLKGSIIAQYASKDVKKFCKAVFNATPEQVVLAYFGMQDLLTKNKE